MVNRIRTRTRSGVQQFFCPRCNKYKPREKFYANAASTHGVSSYCRPCYNSYKEDRDPSGTLRAASSLAWYRANKDYMTAKRYGLSVEDYRRMWMERNGKCDCCGESEIKTRADTGEPYLLGVDHDHVTGEVRGMLCSRCNVALGMLDDNPDRIRKLLSYIERA